MGAYAALQDWDSLYRFAYSHDTSNTQVPEYIQYFDIVTDPLALTSERIGCFLFRRGDVSPAKTEIPIVFSENCLKDPNAFSWSEEEPSRELSCIGLMTKTGAINLSGGKKLPEKYLCAVSKEDVDASSLGGKPCFKPTVDIFDKLAALGAIRKDMYEYNGTAGRFTSDTGEITLDTVKGLRVVTPKSECFVMPENTAEQGVALQAKNKESFCTVSVHSLDDKPLKESSRMVLFHLTDVRNNKMKHRDKKQTILEEWGELPHLVRGGETEITLNTANAGLKVWAIDMAGKRIKEMPVVKKGGTLSFVANTVQEEGTSLAYEIATE
jgi:hypothetical protein